MPSSEQSASHASPLRILVTGAAGFIASHVAEAYQQAGHQVLGIDNLSSGRRENLNPDVAFEKLDLTDEPALQRVFRRFQPEVVSHHAAQADVRLSRERPLDDARANVLGSLALLHQARRGKTRRIIYSSSVGVYGEPRTRPLTEDHPIRPLSNYTVSKYATELYLHSFHVNFGIPYLIFRYPNVYGPRQNPQGEAGVVAIFTGQLLQGVPPRIFGNGAKTRDYVYVDDIVDANLRALRYGPCGVFHLGWGKEITDLEVFEAVRAAAGVPLDPLFVENRPGEIQRISLDANRARRRLGWKPRVDFPEGVRRVVAYWRERLRAPRPTLGAPA